jgi:TonB family protein
MRPGGLAARIVWACLAASLAVAAYAADPETPKLAGSEVPVPKRTKTVSPEYPAEAQALGLRGIVILELVIDTQGHVVSADVIRSVPPFDEAALAVARKWEYEVTKLDGKPVSVRLTVPITFAMRLPELTRQEGIPELRQGALPAFPAGAPPREVVKVTAEVALDADGRVADAQIRNGEPPWSAALLQALRTWRFAPSDDRATLSFRVEASFLPDSKAPQRVELRLSGLRRSETMAVAEAPAAAATPPASAPMAPPASPAPAMPPAAAVASPPSATPPAPAIRTPPTEVLAPPALPAGIARAGTSSVTDVMLQLGVPDLVKGRRPVPPPFARMGGVSGTVEVRFAVDAAGTSSVQAAEGQDALKVAAEQAVGTWTFRRTTADRLLLVAVFSYSGSAASATVKPAE